MHNKYNSFYRTTNKIYVLQYKYWFFLHMQNNLIIGDFLK